MTHTSNKTLLFIRIQMEVSNLYSIWQPSPCTRTWEKKDPSDVASEPPGAHW